MLDFLRGAVRPTLVWLGFVALSAVAVLAILVQMFTERTVPSEVWALVAGWASLVALMVGYYFRAREDK